MSSSSQRFAIVIPSTTTSAPQSTSSATMARRSPPRARKLSLQGAAAPGANSRTSSSALSTPPSSPNGKETPVKKSPTLRGSDQELVTITVTGEKDGTAKKFVLHKAFVCYHSDFFDRCFNGRFVEAETQTMDTTAISVAAFGILADWIYSQKIEDSEGELPPFMDLVDLWILADSLLIPKLKNLVMLAIHTEAPKQQSFPILFFTELYKNTLPESPLRKVFVDLFVHSVEPIDPDVYYPRQMLADIINAVAENNAKKAKIAKEKVAKYLVSED